jgi:DNA-binding SARP family transcriptional activator
MQPAASASVFLRLLGTARLLTPSATDIALPLNDALMLAVLALDGPQSREHLAQFLWPDKPMAGARTNLRQRIKRLDDDTQGKLFVHRDGELALGADVAHDLADLDKSALANAQAARGALLGSHQVADLTSASHQWLDAARARLDAQRGQAIAAHVTTLLAGRHFGDALPHGLRLVAEHPANEGFARLLMLAQHGLGDRAAALQTYDALAARLKQGANSTRPDRQTRELLTQIRCEVAPPLNMADAEVIASPTKRGPATATSPPQPAPDPAVWAALIRPPRLVRREMEWQRLYAVWRQGGVALIEGEAGIGKTRLLGDFADAHQVQLCVRAHHGDPTVPYALLARWVETLLPRAVALEPWSRAELARLVPSLGEAAAGPVAPLRLAQALKRLIQPHDSAWFDDLHFADPASLELLPYVLESLRCSFLATRREEIPSALQRWLTQSAPDVQRITLNFWDPKDVGQVLSTTGFKFTGPEHQNAWAELLWRHTGGHPLLLLETLRSLPWDDSRGLAAEVPAALGMPPRVLELVARRLAQLSVASLQVAQVAALADDAFDAQLAGRVLGCDAQALAAPWQELQNSGFMTAQGRLHDLVLEAVRKGLTTPRHVELSSAIARQLVGPKAAPARLAALWEAADQPDLAAQAHAEAARTAERLGRPAEVVLHWSRSAQCWQASAQPLEAFSANAEAAEAMVRAGDLGAALKQADHLLAQVSTREQRAWAFCIQSGALLFGGQMVPGLAAAEAAEAYCSAEQPHLLSASLSMQAFALAAMGRRPEALRMVARAKALPHLNHLPRVEMNKQTTLAAAMGNLGLTADALATMERQLEHSAGPQFPSERVAMMNNCASLSLKLGLVQRGIDWARQSMAAARQIGEDNGSLAVAAGMHEAIMLNLLGRYKEAGAAFDALHKLAQAPGLDTLRAILNNHAALMWVHLGRADLAYRLLNESPTSLTLNQRLQRAALRAELQRLTGVPSPSADSDLALLNEPPQGVDIEVAAHAALQFARHLPAEACAQRLQALQADLEQHGRPARALQARIALLQTHTILRSEHLADMAHQVGAELESCHPIGYWPEAQWALFQAFSEAGEAAMAQQALVNAWQWVERALAEWVDDPFKASFMERNLVNVQIKRAWSMSQAEPSLPKH